MEKFGLDIQERNLLITELQEKLSAFREDLVILLETIRIYEDLIERLK